MITLADDGRDGTYREMRQQKNRCIRLVYARKFHIDITPAVPERVRQDGPLFVPDRELSIWCASHPVGFADRYAEIANAKPILIHSFGERDDGRIVAGHAQQVEPLPEHGFEKTPLQRVTQLLKRDRDEHFQRDLDRRPTSILLTTLTAHSYAAEVRIAAYDLFEFVTRVVARLNEFIEVKESRTGSPSYHVANPVNPQENFAEKWSRADYEAFVRWQSVLLRKLGAVASTKGRGIDVMLQSLSEGFGKARVLAAAAALGADTSRVHQAGRLRVAGATGILGLAGSAMGATVYHGE